MTVLLSALLHGLTAQPLMASPPSEFRTPPFPGSTITVADRYQPTLPSGAPSEAPADLRLRSFTTSPAPPLLRRIESGRAPTPRAVPSSAVVIFPPPTEPAPTPATVLSAPSWPRPQSQPPSMLSTPPLLIHSAPTIYDSTTFAPPAEALPPPSSGGGFVIGAGDTVQIDVLGQPELSAKGNVSADGRVTVALAGTVHIGGLTPVQAADRIAGAYRQGQFLVSPQVTVTITDYQSQQFTVLGEVRNPGRFSLRAQLSVLDGLALAGGISEQASSHAYLLRNRNGTIDRMAVNLEELIQEGGGKRTIPLLAGDTLLVPETEVFYIYGEVRSPNAYKLKPGMTVIQALSLAGGLTDKGTDRRIDIRRKAGDGKLHGLSATLNDNLQADDVIYVRERLF